MRKNKGIGYRHIIMIIGYCLFNRSFYTWTEQGKHKNFFKIWQFFDNYINII